jgi:hypothetical protein
MSLTRLAHILAAKRAVLALALAAVLMASCGSGSSFFGTLPARFRVFNALIDGGPVNLTVFTEAIVTDLPFEGITTYQNVDAGNREVRVSLAGGTSTIYDATTLILDDASYTYIVSGTSAAPLVHVLTDEIVQDQPPAAGMFRLRISNAAITTASFDVYVTQPGELLANMSPNFSGIAYGSTTTFTTFGAATLQVRFTLPNSKQVIYDAGPLTFKERTVYQMVGYTRGSSTLVNGALLVIDTVGTNSIVDSLLAQLKLVHAAPGTAAVNALIDGTVTFANVPYQSATSYEGVSSGTQTVTVETTTSPGAVIATAQPPLVPATDTSIVVIGVPGAQTAVALSDTNLPGIAGRARVRFVNAGSDLGPVDILVNFAQVFSSVGNGVASTYIEELEDSYTITFDLAGTTTELLTVPSVALTAGRTYTMYLVGTVGQYGTILTRDD